MEGRCASGKRLLATGFFGQILRSYESYSEKWNYIREGPVHASLVAAADEWPLQDEIMLIDRV
jgi:hypothetical protein